MLNLIKKVISIFAVVACFFLIFSFGNTAEAANEAVLTLSSGSVNAGSSVSVNLSIDTSQVLSDGAGIAGVQWDLNFNSSQITSVTVTDGAAATAAKKASSCSTISAGRYRCMVVGFNDGIIHSGVLASVTFTIPSSATIGSSPIHFSDILSSSSGAEPVPTLGVDGSISINAEVVAHTPPPPPTPSPTPAVPDSSVTPTTSSSAASSGGGDIKITPIITNFQVQAMDSQVSISWTNPADQTFVSTIIVRKENSVPNSSTDGIKIYEGTSQSFIDKNISNDKTYYYAAFLVLTSGTASSPSSYASASPKAVQNQVPISNTATTSTSISDSTLANLTFITQTIYRLSTIISRDQIISLQTVLSLQGYKIPIDGLFSNLTEAYIKRYQCDRNIICTGDPYTTGYGKVGPTTRKELNADIQKFKQTSINSPVNTSTQTKIVFTNTLYLGVANNQVSLLQNLLAKDPNVYPEGKVSGYFGTLTRKAVQRFQTKYGIVSSGSEYTTGYGLVGAKTREKLNILLNGGTLIPQQTLPSNTVPQKNTTSQNKNIQGLILGSDLYLGSYGADVLKLQAFLKQQGFYEGIYNGSLDSATKSAVIKFQQKYGLSPVGIVDSATRAKIQAVSSGT